MGGRGGSGALEMFPAAYQSSAEPAEYQSAREYVETHGQSEKVFTLSRSEWEAAGENLAGAVYFWINVLVKNSFFSSFSFGIFLVPFWIGSLLLPTTPTQTDCIFGYYNNNNSFCNFIIFNIFKYSHNSSQYFQLYFLSSCVCVPVHFHMFISFRYISCLAVFSSILRS